MFRLADCSGTWSGQLYRHRLTGTAAIANAFEASRSTPGPPATRSAAPRPRPATSSPPTAYSGVEIDDANDNLVEGNYVGTDITGTVALGNNVGDGLMLTAASSSTRASGNTIGGLTATPGTGAGNLISGNIFAGVIVYDAGSNNLVAGNLIGTDVTGTVALGNPSIPRRVTAGLASTSTTRPTPSWVSRAAAT